MASRTRRYVVAFCIALLAVAAAWRWAHPPEARVSVYFIRAQASSSTVQDVTRTVQGRGPEALLAAAVRELLAGPTPAERGEGLVSAIPAGTHLRGLRIADGVVMVDLSQEIESRGGSSSMLGRLCEIGLTPTQLRHAPGVRFRIAAPTRAAPGGGQAAIDHPLAGPAS